MTYIDTFKIKIPEHAKIIRALKKHGEDLLDGDGWAIMPPDYYIEKGIPEETLSGLERTHKSDLSNHKSTIYVDGKAVKELKGIHNLTFLYRLAHKLEVDYESKIGRGFQAQVICSAIRKKYSL